jgi:peptidoglycan/LPS O-acetylase OafA/YrhL
MQALTHDEYLSMRRLPALDGLRAVAALMVVAFHFGGPGWSWLSGWLGVHVFFVLSGFLITTLSLREEDRKGRVSLRDFYLRRVFRIFPAYYVVLGISVAMAAVRDQYSSYAPLLPYYLTFNNEFVGPAPFAHTWTLGIEQKFYLVWPVLAFVVARASFGRRIGVTLLALAILPVVVVFFQDSGNGSWVVHYIAILLGCLMAIVMHNPRGFALVKSLTHPVGSVVACLVFLAVHLSIDPAMGWLAEHVSFTEKYKIVFGLYGIPVALLIPALLGAGPARWALGRPFMVYVGERSYSLYLVQYIGAFLAAALVPQFGTPRTLTWIGVAIVSLLMADLIYRYVEQPMIALGRKVVNREKRKPPAAESPAAAEPPTVVDVPVEPARAPAPTPV